MRPLAGLAVLLAVAGLTGPAAGAAPPEHIDVPPARVGDAWTIDAGPGLRFHLEVEEPTTALDRWGEERAAFPVRVEGPHPVQIFMTATGHHMFVDAASGAQVADVIEVVLDAGDFGVSETGAVSGFGPNDPALWPGWTLAGGLLSGRRLIPGESVAVPLVVSSSRGNDRLVLTVEETPTDGDRRCVDASGTATFPSYVGYSDGVGSDRGELRLTAELHQCTDAPYAEWTRVTFAGAVTHTITTSRTALNRGQGSPVGAGEHTEADRHLLDTPVAFDGRLRDGGELEVLSLETAQDAAAGAPGFLAWELLHPDGYLVEAEYTAPDRELDGLPNVLGVGAERWRLTYADPSGPQHVVEAHRRLGQVIAIDRPQTDDYPEAVPPLSAWPDLVASPTGIIAAWRSLADPDAAVKELRWHPLRDYRWTVRSDLPLDCGDEECATAVAGLPMSFDFETGAATEGMYPLPRGA